MSQVPQCMSYFRWGLAGASALLSWPASAVAMIQVDRGIAGARLGNTRAQVRAALGTPERVTDTVQFFGPLITYYYEGHVQVEFEGRKRATTVRTYGRTDRTPSGVGVGSREREVRRRVRGVTCETDREIRLRFCYTDGPGRRHTIFYFSRGRVDEVSIGRWERR